MTRRVEPDDVAIDQNNLKSNTQPHPIWIACTRFYGTPSTALIGMLKANFYSILLAEVESIDAFMDAKREFATKLANSKRRNRP
jgi:hypothetical protein